MSIATDQKVELLKQQVSSLERLIEQLLMRLQAIEDALAEPKTKKR